ncbi:SDR family oxidoreductase [Corynebacterium sp. zg-331]|uniref:SDR family oxidoreductase n=1 Tax=unclassified Corynebacterium TaxID=2624378 RepID=UPI0016427E2C|nr:MULTISPECIES: SDR family oxidoreductase [unclassified Corynebacterium]MBC3186533.1 SDR family oxidoreductase [Corynebacterium sp. zg-331]
MPHAVITGASGGVGRDVAALLLEEGWEISAQYRSHPDVALDASWWRADFRRPLPGHLPLPDRIDALIHCAGVCPIGTTADLPRDAWEESLAVNLHAPVELTARALPALRAAGGHVVYVNSGAGYHSKPRWSAYSAAKHAARAWCDALRAEEPQIRVTSVYPGRIATAMQRDIVAELGEAWRPEFYLETQEVARAVVAALGSHTTDIQVRP